MSEEAYSTRKGTMREYIKQQREQDPNFKLKPSNASSSSRSVTCTALIECMSRVLSNDAPYSSHNMCDVHRAPDSTSDEPPPGAESVQGMTSGQRCEVQPGSRRGLVMFVGEVDGLKPGYWVSIKQYKENRRKASIAVGRSEV
jgi:hypothetical protein